MTLDGPDLSNLRFLRVFYSVPLKRAFLSVVGVNLKNMTLVFDKLWLTCPPTKSGKCYAQIWFYIKSSLIRPSYQMRATIVLLVLCLMQPMLGAVHDMSTVSHYCIMNPANEKLYEQNKLILLYRVKPCWNNHFCILVCGVIFNNFISVDNTRINYLTLKNVLKGVFPQIMPKRASVPT